MTPAAVLRIELGALKNESKEIPLEVTVGEKHCNWPQVVAVVVVMRVFDIGLYMGHERRSRVTYDPKVSILSKWKNGLVIY